MIGLDTRGGCTDISGELVRMGERGGVRRAGHRGAGRGHDEGDTTWFGTGEVESNSKGAGASDRGGRGELSWQQRLLTSRTCARRELKSVTGELETDGRGSNLAGGLDEEVERFLEVDWQALRPGLHCRPGSPYPVFMSISDGSSSLFLGGGGESIEGAVVLDLLLAVRL